MFRHSYCAARLQSWTVVLRWRKITVVREQGHGSPAMVRRIYGHLGTVRHRAEVIEFRVEQHKETKVREGKTVSAMLAEL